MRKSKNILITVTGVLLFLVGFYLMRKVVNPQGVLKTLPGLLIGIGCGIFGNGVGNMFNSFVKNSNPEYAKKVDREQNDERNIMISNMAKAKGFDTMTFVFAALLLSYSLLQVSMEAILTFVVAYLFVQFYTVYIRIKKEKEY